MKEIIKTLQGLNLTAIPYDEGRVYFADSKTGRGIVVQGERRLSIVFMMCPAIKRQEIIMSDTLFRYCIRFPANSERTIINAAPIGQNNDADLCEGLKRCFLITEKLFAQDTCEVQVIKENSKHKRKEIKRNLTASERSDAWTI